MTTKTYGGPCISSLQKKMQHKKNPGKKENCFGCVKRDYKIKPSWTKIQLSSFTKEF